MKWKVYTIDAWGDTCGECDRCHGDDEGYGCWTYNNWRELIEVHTTDVDDPRELFVEFVSVDRPGYVVTDTSQVGTCYELSCEATGEPLFFAEIVGASDED